MSAPEPLIWLGDTQRVALATRLQSAVREWCSGEGIEASVTIATTPGAIAVRPPCPGTVIEGQLDADSWLEVCVPDRLFALAVGLPLQAPVTRPEWFAETPLARAWREPFLDGLLSAIAGRPVIDVRPAPLGPESPGRLSFARRRHVVAVSLDVGHEQVDVGVALSPALLHGLLPTRVAPPPSRASASARQQIGSSRAHCSARLKGATVTLPELLALRAGDVVVLDAPLAEGIRLHTTQGTFVATGRLGQHAGRRALQVTALAVDSPSLASQ